MSDRYRSVFSPGLFEGRRVWVTGGGSGIGRCVAHELASLGARVLISGRSEDKLKRVAAEIAEDGGQCEWRAFDIRDEAAVKQHVADALHKEVEKWEAILGLIDPQSEDEPASRAA